TNEGGAWRSSSDEVLGVNGLEMSAQDIDGPEGGEIESRIAAGDQPGKKDKAEPPDPKPGVAIRNGEPGHHQVVEPGQDEDDNTQGKDACRTRDKKGFSEEAADEASPARPYHLTDAYFPAAADTAGRTQVHIIDTRDQEDKGGDDGEHADEVDAAAGGPAIHEIGIEMPFAHGMKEELGG